MRWLLVVGLLGGCGQIKEETGYAPTYDNDLYDVLPDFQPFVQQFEIEAELRDVKINIRPITIKWANLEKNTLGTCWLQDDKEPLIEIDQSRWSKMGNCDKEWLIFHEVSHCKLRRDHDEVFLEHGKPRSIMYPYYLGCSVYLENRDYYLDELFSKNKLVWGLHERR